MSSKNKKNLKICKKLRKFGASLPAARYLKIVYSKGIYFHYITVKVRRK